MGGIYVGYTWDKGRWGKQRGAFTALKGEGRTGKMRLLDSEGWKGALLLDCFGSQGPLFVFAMK
jgi:hypothetical protein